MRGAESYLKLTMSCFVDIHGWPAPFWTETKKESIRGWGQRRVWVKEWEERRERILQLAAK